MNCTCNYQTAIKYLPKSAVVHNRNCPAYTGYQPKLGLVSEYGIKIQPGANFKGKLGLKIRD
jgi:hypothetical protein